MLISILSLKGGVGKSTLCVQLACVLAQGASKRVLLIDGDSNRSCLKWASRGSLPLTVVDEQQAAGRVTGFDHCLIDTQARPDPEDLTYLARQADLVVVPSPPSVMDLDATLETLAALVGAGCQRYAVVLTRCPSRGTDADDARAFLRARDIPVMDGEMKERQVYRKAALFGLPVNQVKDRTASAAWSEIELIAGEVLAHGQKQI